MLNTTHALSDAPTILVNTTTLLLGKVIIDIMQTARFNQKPPS